MRWPSACSMVTPTMFLTVSCQQEWHKLATANGAALVREVFTGAYASDFGVWDTDAGSAGRHQHAIGAQGLRMLFNSVPESNDYLGSRDVAEVARSGVFNGRPDALCVSGLTAGV